MASLRKGIKAEKLETGLNGALTHLDLITRGQVRSGLPGPQRRFGIQRRHGDQR